MFNFKPKYWIAFVGIIVLALSLLVITKYLPDFIYYSWLEGRSYSHWYSLNNFREELLDGNWESAGKTSLELAKDPNWEDIHINQLELPIPIDHPDYYFVPQMVYLGTGTKSTIGVTIYNKANQVVFKLEYAGKFPYRQYLEKNRIFNLPYSRNILNKRSAEDIWRDLFTSRLMDEPKNINEMLINLHILSLRDLFFPYKYKRFLFREDMKIGVIDLPQDDKDLLKEQIWFKQKGQILTYIVQTNTRIADAIVVRERFIQNVKYVEPDPYLIQKYYTNFRDLDYHQKISQKGLAILFSCWSQTMDSEEFVREMIFYMERGKNSGQIITPLYEYALSRYGSNFSFQRKKFSNIDKKIQEMAREEIQVEANKLDVEKPDFDFEKATPEELQNYFLNKAKDNKKSLDSKDSLFVD